jgi:transposase-like protein
MGKRHYPEQIVRKLRDVEARPAGGATVPEIARELGISEATFHRWRYRYGGMNARIGSCYRHPQNEKPQPVRQGCRTGQDRRKLASSA